MNLAGTRVTVENTSVSFPCSDWVAIGLPEPVSEPTFLAFGDARAGFGWPAYAIGRELFVRCRDLAPGAKETRYLYAATPEQRWEFHTAEWVSDQWAKLVPEFMVERNGVVHRATAAIARIESSPPVRLTVHWRASLGGLHITGWYRIFHDQEVVEFGVRASYGDTRMGHSRDATYGTLSMFVGEFPVVDYRVPKGLHEPVWRVDPAGGIRWEVELSRPRDWLRTRTIEQLGALLCLPPAAKFLEAARDPRALRIAYRREAPPRGMVEQAAWDGRYGAFGVVPRLDQAAAARQRLSVLGTILGRLNRSGDEMDPRAFGQPPYAGTTGEQVDFGAAAGGQVFAYGPSMLWHLRYDAQAWSLRPYRNLEQDGSPVLAQAHPNCRTYNRLPYDRRNGNDMLGWPPTIGWLSGYATADAQHDTANLLCDLFMMAPDPGLAESIESILELDLMSIGRGIQAAPGSGIGSPRGVGRPLKVWCKMLRCGFRKAETLIRDTIANCEIAASYTLLDPNDPAQSVRVLSNREAKYGWDYPNGTPVRCWLPWQESIGVMGAFAAFKVLGIGRDLCVNVGRTIARHGFYRLGQGWLCCYGVRWREDAPGEPIPEAAYSAPNPNYDAFTYGMQRWTLPALRILIALEPQGPASDRAREILAHYGPPKDWGDAHWWAVTS